MSRSPFCCIYRSSSTSILERVPCRSRQQSLLHRSDMAAAPSPTEDEVKRKVEEMRSALVSGYRWGADPSFEDQVLEVVRKASEQDALREIRAGSQEERRIIVLGKPGSGVTTVAAAISRRHGICHICMGDMLRDEVRKETPTGKAIAGRMAKGELLEDDVAWELFSKRAAESDAQRGFVLDGFPRTLTQAHKLAEALHASGKHLTKVVLLDIDDEAATHRVEGRIVNPRYHRTYNTLTMPPAVPFRDDVTCEPLVRRDDDLRRSVSMPARLNAFREETEPVLHYYHGQTAKDGSGSLLAMVSGAGPVDWVLYEVDEALKTKEG